MPNYVTNRIEFTDVNILQRLIDKAVRNGTLIFELLIPQPEHLYHGDLSEEDKKDFPDNWYLWNIRNWGTKWDACNETVISTEPPYIQFDTAWSVPYPIIAAIANLSRDSFVHTYYDEGENFWGIETWKVVYGTPSRVSYRKSDQSDLNSIRALFDVEVDDSEAEPTEDTIHD